MFNSNIEVFGLEEVLRDLEMTAEQIDEGMDEIAKEVATEILDAAIENVNGPRVGTSKGKIYKRYKSTVKQGYQPYPVAVRTGTLKRSMKIKQIGQNRYKVFADMNVAKYAWWVHEGTGKMEARPFLDDAKDSILSTGKYLEIANQILDEILNR